MIPIDLPIDNASHTIALTHQGSAGNFFYTDAMLIPSPVPNPIIVMGNEVVTANLWTAAQCGTWQANRLILEPYLRDVVAEFSHAYWADSTMTINGLYSGDGIHPNTRGMHQRKNDAIEILKLLDNWVRNYEQSQIVDASFEVV